MKTKCFCSGCGFILFTLALALPQNIFAQTTYYWQTIVTPVAISGGPQGLAVDSAGNIYIADTTDNTILEATPSGTNWVVTTIAGLAGVSGSDDGIGSAALFNSPNSLTLSAPGTLIVADTANDTIRKVQFTDGGWQVTTLAGVLQDSNDVFFADGTNNQAQFNFPTGVAADTSVNPEVIYVADEDNSVIRKMTSTDGTNWVVTTIAGSLDTAGTAADGTNGDAGFNYPYDVAMNQAGELFVADYANSIIRKLTPSGTNWIVTTIAGQAQNSGSADGTNLDAQFRFPSGVCVDAAGNVFVSDTFNDTIRELTPDGTNWVVTTIGGSAGSGGLMDGTNDAAQFSDPQGVTVDAGGIVYVGDTGNNALRFGFVFPPTLSLALAGGQAVLSYPPALGTNFNFMVQSATNLAGDNWSDVTNQWQLDVNGTPHINLPITNRIPDQFFRLKIP